MALKLKVDIIKRIKLLRSRGYSLPEISNELFVSRTSVLRHISGVKILPEFLSEWAGKRGGSKKIMLEKEAKAYEEGKIFVGKLSNRDKLLLLSALYWAEGSKKDFSLANTDPNLIFVFMECMRDVFSLENDKFYINIRIYEDLDKEQCLSFWSEVTRISKERLKGVNILTGKKKGKLEYGMCRVRVAKAGDLLKKIKGINKAIFNSLSL